MRGCSLQELNESAAVNKKKIVTQEAEKEKKATPA